MACIWLRSIFVINFYFKCHEDVCGSCLQVFCFSYVIVLDILQVEDDISGDACKSVIDVRLVRS